MNLYDTSSVAPENPADFTSTSDSVRSEMSMTPNSELGLADLR